MRVDREIDYCRQKAVEFRALAKEYLAAGQNVMATRLEEIAGEFDARADVLERKKRSLLNAESEIRLATDYQVRFFDRNGRIVGRDDFVAIDDADALLVAAMLADACADCCARFELWQGGRPIESSFNNDVSVTAKEIAAEIQDTVLECEVAIRNSRWPIVDSMRLLEETKRLLEHIRGRPPSR